MNPSPHCSRLIGKLSSAAWLAAIAIVMQLSVSAAPAPEASRPNVLIISIDDLNDWVGTFGGNPQTRTPNMDRFCAEGAVTFQNAYCPGPVCGPSRSAFLSGFMPYRTGIYGNSQNMRRSPLVQTHATLPEYFAQNGYQTINRGKFFHKHATADGLDEGQWAFTDWSSTEGAWGVNPSHLYSRLKGVYDGTKGAPTKDDAVFSRDDEGTEFAWGPTREGKEGTPDYLTSQWAADELSKQHDKPFFMVVGISKPHLPWYVPQEYFDRFPLDGIVIPEYKLDDLDDILTPDGKRKFSESADFKWVTRKDHADLFKRAVQAYLAAAAYSDECVGVVLDGLAKSAYKDNTIVMIFGDHGWHLGEKLRFRKATLWQEATRLPLMVRAPGITSGRAESPRLVNLMDLYKTLIELCGLPPKAEIDGRSFVPLLKEPARSWQYPTMTINGLGNASIRDERWYYIRYQDGTEEFYDMRTDPMQWKNLARSSDPEVVAAKRSLAALYPSHFAPDLPRNPPKKQVRSNLPPLPSPDIKRDLSKLK
ncbi:MAG: sulfatase [Opitutaceae bacterium]|nr:sulfatase [Opitutaceae bacterium]